MNTRAISTLLITLALGVGAPAMAQKTESDAPSEEASETEEEPTTRERMAPSSGPLPVEDPTIHQQQDFESVRQQKAEPEGSPQDADAASGEEGEDEAESGAAGLPVEDPTIHEEADPVSEAKPEEDGAKKEGEEPKDWAQPVKVAYGYQGGLLVSVNDWFYLALSGLVQARYAVNYRTKPPTDLETGVREKQVTQGFDVARARFHLGVGLTEFVALYMRIGVVSGGDFSGRPPPTG